MHRRVSFRIRYDRPSDLAALLTLGLLATCFVAYLAWGYQRAVAASPQSPRVVSSYHMRQFYLTPDAVYTGATALTACDTGYHMASLWEILDPSSLKYNTEKGFTDADSGQGAPAGPAGWIRTGTSSLGSSTAGYASCLAWTSGDSGDHGSGVWLSVPWTGDPIDIHVWDAGVATCNVSQRVWCVEDEAGRTVYLPLVIRSS
jgi:hypothetical protein